MTHVPLPPVSADAVRLRATVEREAVHATDECAMIGAAVVLGHKAINQIARDRSWPSPLVGLITKAAIDFDELCQPAPYRCGWEGVGGRCDLTARPGYKTCQRHRRFEADAADHRGKANPFQPGDRALHVSNKLDARHVESVDGPFITLRIGDTVTPPLPCGNYTKVPTP